MVFYYFFQKSLFTENYFLIAAINLATRGPLYTCLVYVAKRGKTLCSASSPGFLRQFYRMHFSSDPRAAWEGNVAEKFEWRISIPTLTIAQPFGVKYPYLDCRLPNWTIASIFKR